MTDKQIVYNGVDVSTCEFLTKTGHCRAQMSIMGIDANKCKCFSNCHYKLYKHKEQEYEELRQYHNKCCEENSKKIEELLEKYNQVSRDFFIGKYCKKEYCDLLKAKEKECNELKLLNTMLNSALGYRRAGKKTFFELSVELYQLKAENEKLKQALAKIKEIAENRSNYPCGKCIKTEILQISEVLKDE